MADQTTEILLKATAEADELKEFTKEFSKVKVTAVECTKSIAAMGAQLSAAADTAEIKKLLSSLVSISAESAKVTAAERAQSEARRKAIAETKALAEAERARAKDIERSVLVTFYNMRNAAAAAKKTADEVKKIKPSLDQASGSAEGFASSIGKGFKFFAGIAAAQLGANSISSIFEGTVKNGVQFNATLETAQIGVASVLRQFNPEKFTDFNAALGKSGELVNQLKVAALQTGATFEELLEGFQGTAGAMASANIPIEKQIGLTVRLSQTLVALGIPTRELRQETTALLLGQIDANARAAKTLGITAEQVASAREQGQLFEFLMRKTEAFGAAADVASASLTLLKSNLDDAVTLSNADATKELTEAYKGLLGALTELVKSDAYKGIVGGFASVATAIVNTAEAIVTSSNISQKLSAEGKLDEYQKRAELIAADLKAATSSEAVALSRSRAQAALSNFQKDIDALGIDKPTFTGDPATDLAMATRMEGLREQIAITKTSFRELVSTVDQFGFGLLSGNRVDAQNASSAAAIEKGFSDSKRAQQQASEWLVKNREAYEERARASERSLISDKAQIKVIDERIAKVKDELSLDLLKADTIEVYTATELKANDEILKLLKEREAAEGRITAEKKRQASEAEELARREDRTAARRMREQYDREQKIRNESVSVVNDSRFLTDKQKRAQLFSKFSAEKLALPGAIASAQAFESSLPANSSSRAAAETETQRLINRRDIGNPSDLRQNAPSSTTDDILAQITEIQNGFMTVGQAVGTTVQGAIDGVASSMQGLLQGTMSWGQALQNIGGSVLNSVIGAISRMFAEWIVGRAAAGAASMLWSAKEGAADVAAKTPGALLTSISSFGVAAVLGVAALVAALASFDVGGYTSASSTERPVGVVHANEWVAPPWMTQDPKYGSIIAGLESARTGSGSINFGSGAPAYMGGVGGLANNSQSDSAPGASINQAFFNTQQDAEEWLRSQPGRRVMVDFLRKNQYDL